METRAQKAKKEKLRSEGKLPDETDELLIESPPKDKPKRERKKYKRVYTAEQKERMKAYKKRYLATFGEEVREKNRVRCRERYANLTEEQKEVKKAYYKQYRAKYTPEQRERYRSSLKGSYAKLSEEKKEKKRAYKRHWRTTASEEQREKTKTLKRESYARLHKKTLVIEIPGYVSSLCQQNLVELAQDKLSDGSNFDSGSSDIMDEQREENTEECTPQIGDTDLFTESEDWKSSVKTECDVDE